MKYFKNLCRLLKIYFWNLYFKFSIFRIRFKRILFKFLWTFFRRKCFVLIVYFFVGCFFHSLLTTSIDLITAYPYQKVIQLEIVAAHGKIMHFHGREEQREIDRCLVGGSGRGRGREVQRQRKYTHHHHHHYCADHCS